MMSKVTTAKRELAEKIVSNIGAVVSRKQILAFVKADGGSVADVRWIFNTKKFRAGRGLYDLTSLNGVDESATPAPVSLDPFGRSA